MNAFAACLLALLAAAVPAAAAVAPAPPAPEPARTGSYEADLTDPQTSKFLVHYAVRAPDILPKERTLGLIVGFHGNGGSATDMPGVWGEALKRSNLSDRYVIVAPKAQGAYLTKVDDEAVTKLIDWAIATYPIDQRQVYANGFSAGGWYAADYGTAHQERFAAISMYGAGMRGNNPPLKSRDLAPPIYIVVGTEDSAATKSSYSAREKLGALHFRFVFREIAGMGHCVGNDAVVADNLRWMGQQRSNFQPPSPEQMALLRQFADAKKAPALWTDNAQAAQLVAIGGGEVAAVSAKSARNKDEAVRLAIAKHSSEGWFGPDQLALLAGNLKDRSADIRQASIAGMANAAGWNCLEAKQTLVEIAAAKRFDLADRLVAVKCLGDAATLIPLCDRWDDTVIMPGLAAMLNDPQLEIRTAAAAILVPTRTSGDFGYDPAAAASARTAAVTQWQTWVAERCSGWKDPPLPVAKAGGKAR